MKGEGNPPTPLSGVADQAFEYTCTNDMAHHPREIDCDRAVMAKCKRSRLDGIGSCDR